MKHKRSSNSTKSFDCCRTAKFISRTGTRKDVLVRNPQNVHFAKKVIVGNQFRNLLKVLYRDHSKDAQAIKRKITDGHFQLSGSKGEDGDDKISIYNIEGKSDASRNKTIIELRAAILKLLDKVVKKAKSSHLAEQRDQKQEFPNQLSGQNKTAKTEIQESYKDTRPSLDKDEDLSAKRANYLDLLNFITRMKSTEIGRDVDSRHKNRMPSLNGMDTNGLSGMLNQRDLMTGNLFRPMPQMPDLSNAQNENGFLPGNGLQMQEMNLAEQRKLIEDQMENHVAQLQLKAKLLEQQQQGVAPVQNLQNSDQMSNFMQNLQNAIATPSVGVNPFGFRREPMFQQAPSLPRVNPYSPFAKPFPRFRTGPPFIYPMNPRLRYPPDNEDDDYDDDDVDDDNDERDRDRDRDEPPPHHPVREFEDNDDDDEEHNDSDNDER